MNVKTNPHLYAERSRSRHLLHRRTRITDVKGKTMTTDVKGKAMNTDVKEKTTATGAKGKTKATDLKEFLSNLATDPRKLGEFLHTPEAVMSATNLSEADKTALRSGVSGMVAARLGGTPVTAQQIGKPPKPPTPQAPQIRPNPTPPSPTPPPHGHTHPRPPR